MLDTFILKLIILALGAVFIAVIIALVLFFNVTQKLMKHNVNLAERSNHLLQQEINDETNVAIYR